MKPLEAAALILGCALAMIVIAGRRDADQRQLIALLQDARRQDAKLVDELWRALCDVGRAQAGALREPPVAPEDIDAAAARRAAGS